MEHTFESWRAQGRHFSHRGHTIFFQAAGNAAEGPSLLCIHGLPTASWDFHALWPELSAHFAQVLAPDMIGFGWSDKPPSYEYSIFDQADLHEALLRAQGIGRFRILAHDYGVSVAQELLKRDQERRAQADRSLQVEAVCFLNGGLFPESHRAMLIQKLMLGPLGPLIGRAMSQRTFARNFAKVFGPETKPTPTELAQFWQLARAGGGPRVFHKLFHYIPERRAQRERWVSALLDATVPMRLINGPEDPVSGAHVVVRYCELVPKPDAVSLPRIGHYPHVEDPGGVWRAAREVLLR